MGSKLANKWLVSDYIANYYEFVFLKLQSHNVAVVFGRYHDFSVKSSTRAVREKFSARTHFLTPSSTLRGKSVPLRSASCKIQVIRYISDGVIQRAVSDCYSNKMLITGLLATPTEKTHGTAIERRDLKASHEEADLIMVQQTYENVLDYQVDIVYVICDDTDVLVLFIYFYCKFVLSSTVYMQGTSTERNPRFCPYTGEYGSVKTRIPRYFTQCLK